MADKRRATAAGGGSCPWAHRALLGPRSHRHKDATHLRWQYTQSVTGTPDPNTKGCTRPHDRTLRGDRGPTATSQTPGGAEDKFTSTLHQQHHKRTGKQPQISVKASLRPECSSHTRTEPRTRKLTLAHTMPNPVTPRKTPVTHAQTLIAAQVRVRLHLRPPRRRNLRFSARSSTHPAKATGSGDASSHPPHLRLLRRGKFRSTPAGTNRTQPLQSLVTIRPESPEEPALSSRGRSAGPGGLWEL